ncbi:MAG: hypothetical protein WCY32_02915 [Burkholderiaceae bacterium]
MATAAERQRAYRQRARTEHNQRRVNVWLDAAAAIAIGRLAKHWGISQRDAIERLAVEAQDAVMRQLDDDGLERFLSRSVTG